MQKLRVAEESGSCTVPSLGKKQGLMVLRSQRKLCWTMVVDCGSGGRWEAQECRDGCARKIGTYHSC